jgi:hypothetical protein
MRSGVGRDFELRSPKVGVSAAGSRFCVSKRRISQSPATRLLRIQQPPSHQVQIGERRGDFQAMQVLGKAPIAHLPEAEDILHHPEHVLNLGSHARLGTIRRLDLLIDPATPSIALVGEGDISRRNSNHPGQKSKALRPFGSV